MWRARWATSAPSWKPIPRARARLQTAAEGIIRSLLPSAQVRIAEFIGQVVANWDTETVVDRLELRVGTDLQYIRMNGTIVGLPDRRSALRGAGHVVLRATF